jgi:hypothetical protein
MRKRCDAMGCDQKCECECDAKKFSHYHPWLGGEELQQEFVYSECLSFFFSRIGPDLDTINPKIPRLA